MGSIPCVYLVEFLWKIFCTKGIFFDWYHAISIVLITYCIFSLCLFLIFYMLFSSFLTTSLLTFYSHGTYITLAMVQKLLRIWEKGVSRHALNWHSILWFLIVWFNNTIEIEIKYIYLICVISVIGFIRDG